MMSRNDKPLFPTVGAVGPRARQGVIECELIPVAASLAPRSGLDLPDRSPRADAWPRHPGLLMKSLIRNRLRRTAAALVVAMLSTHGAWAQSEISDPESVVEAREIAFARTMADRDFSAFKSFISPEAVFFGGRRALRGRATIVDEWAKYFAAEEPPFSWHPDTVEILESGELALSSGDVYSPDGQVIGRFTSIWRKDDDGVWRVVFDKNT